MSPANVCGYLGLESLLENKYIDVAENGKEEKKKKLILLDGRGYSHKIINRCLTSLQLPSNPSKS